MSLLYSFLEIPKLAQFLTRRQMKFSFCSRPSLSLSLSAIKQIFIPIFCPSCLETASQHIYTIEVAFKNLEQKVPM